MPQSAEYIKEQLQKATDKDGSVIKDMQAILEIFSKLEKMKITKEELEITRLGLLVNNIRKAAKTPEVSSRAKKLIKTWQKMLHPDQGKQSSRPSTPQTIKKPSIINAENNTKTKNEIVKTINTQKTESSPNGLKLKLKLPIGSKTSPEKTHILNISQEHGNKKKASKTDDNGKEKVSKKKHKKSKKQHKSPHKQDQLAIKMQAALKVKENLDRRNNNDSLLQRKNIINTVTNKPDATFDVGVNKTTNGENHVTSTKSLKRKYEDTPEETFPASISNSVPIKKFKNKSNETINHSNKISPGRQKLKERGLSYDASTGTLLPVSLPSQPVNASLPTQQTPIALIKTEVKQASGIGAKHAASKIKMDNTSLEEDIISDKHYPTMLSPHIKIINTDGFDFSKGSSNCKLTLQRECSEHKKKKVKEKKYPFDEDDNSSENDETHITNQFTNSVQSTTSSSAAKPHVTCSLKHEWTGVSGCKGNNKKWYNWDEEIFIKPASDKHLNEMNNETDSSIPLQILPYVELE